MEPARGLGADIPRLLMEDHCDAYPLWKQHGFRGRTCVHVDAHLDVSADGFTAEGLERIAACRTAAELEGFRGSEYLPWGGLHCGNYLYPALLEGVVEHLVWVVPPHLPGPDPLGWARQELQNWVELTVAEYRSLHLLEGRVEGTLAGRRLTICPPDRLPRFASPVLLDVDIDYLLDAQDRPWQSPAELAADLAHLPVAALTVAWSVNGGYLPLEHRYLGNEVYALLAGGDDRWSALAEAFLQGRADLPAEAPPWFHAAAAVRRGLAEGQVPGGPAWAEAARLCPDWRFQPVNQGAMHFRRREYEAAVEWLGRAAEESPAEAPLCRYMQGLAEAKAGRLAEAARRWETLLAEAALAPLEASYVRYMRGKVLAALGRPEEAAESFRLALETEPGHPLYAHQHGLALRDSGRPDEAARELRRAVRLAPERLGAVDARLALAEIYQAQGKLALAQAEHRKVQELDATGIYTLRSLLRS